MLKDGEIKMGDMLRTGPREDCRCGKRGFLVGVYRPKELLRSPYVATFLNCPSLLRVKRALARPSAGESQGLNADTSESFLSGVLGSSTPALGLGLSGEWKSTELDRGTQMSFAFPGLMTVA